MSIRRYWMGGASAVAIAAALMCALPRPALASCEAEYGAGGGGGAPSVSVNCDDAEEDPTEAFATSFDNVWFTDGGTPSQFGYDGAGADTIVITGGTIIQGDGIAEDLADPVAPYPPIIVNADPAAGDVDEYFLDERVTEIDLGGGNDTFTMEAGGVGSGGTVGAADARVSIVLGGGQDTFTLEAGTINGDVFGDANDDTGVTGDADSFSISGGSILGGVFMEGGDDSLTMTGGAGGGSGTISGSIFGQSGADAVTISAGTVGGSIFGGADGDTVNVSGSAVITGAAGLDAVGLEDGDDTFVMTGGSIGASVSGGNGVDQMRMEGGTIAGFLAGNAGDDVINILGGAIQGGVQGNEGADQITMSGGSTGVLTGDEGNDTIAVSGTAQVESVQGAGGADTISVTGGAVSANVSGGDGNDSISIAGGTIQTGVAGDAGDDVLTVSGGTVGQNVTGGDGSDTVEMRGGTVSGGIEAETVRLYGGTVGGDITGLTGNTLVIDDAEAAEALVLRDGVLFSGSNVVGTVEDSNLAAGGVSQNFSGFSSLSLANSTLRFESGTQTIDSLFLTGGSTLFIDGVATLAAQNGGFGSLSSTGSTISMVDGDPTDQLILGGIVLNGTTIGIDVNQSAGQADLLVANGAASASGNNTVLVNLVGGLELTGTTDIAILTANGTELGGVFTVEGISGTAASLFDYEVVAGPNGGLVLRATPIGGLIGLVSSVDAAASAATLETTIQALEGINDDAIEHALGLAGGSGTPNNAVFGVFASGQFARVEHDGFWISDGATTFAGPSFSSDDFSAAISVDFNAAKHWGFDAEYGLNLGVFAGFTSTDLTVDGYGGFASVGAAENESGMGGVYALMRRQQNYLLLSATGFWGETQIANGVLDGAQGEYATEGYAVTASAGHIFAIGEKTRFDLRGGLLGASFSGDAYTDSRGVRHGETEISFGAVKFEPGVYAEYALESGMIFSPYARADLQLRFGYENTASADTRTFEFDDEDFSAALATGFNLRMNPSTTLSGELRGKASSDSTTLAAKLGLKVAF